MAFTRDDCIRAKGGSGAWRQSGKLIAHVSQAGPVHVGRLFTERVAQSHRRGVDERVRLTLVRGRERVGLGRIGRNPR